ncbi:DUF1993 domain-containing protein [Mesorhizobium sp. BAC0120]|uniref:DUF1993 domain-containing protein n=1 Tax=Mesorhizobium sp. BAC0120 TaxID=3090670 RepID=UPI00298C581F|nr:DUF1993 domain-containing protein [Mesorhizobium sp. BAC0120]MDW6022695.1 DUF1993 domain-containing protein [Mesorhizobium sp. BAC0120]
MSVSLYHVSVPMFLHSLGSLANVLTKAEANAVERKVEPSVLVNARLSPDMFPLKRQVQLASDHAKGASSRLAGREIPPYEDTEETFADLHARIAKTRDYLGTFAEIDFEGAEDRPIVIKGRQRDLNFTGLQYLQHFALPNFFFHLTTAYDILRHNGVPLSKVDFLGNR